MDKLLLDTTYLLPLVGIDIGLKHYSEIFPKLHYYYELYYTPLSIIEAKWIVIKTIKRLKDKSLKQRLLKEYRNGVDLLQASNYYKSTVITNGLIEEIADELLDKGIKDYFDRMIYATAAYYNAVLLTEDEALRKLYNKRKTILKPNRVIDWNTIISIIKPEQ